MNTKRTKERFDMMCEMLLEMNEIFAEDYLKIDIEAKWDDEAPGNSKVSIISKDKMCGCILGVGGIAEIASAFGYNCFATAPSNKGLKLVLC